MSQQYQEMFQDYSSTRSPGTGRAYSGLTLNRQTSRQFDYTNGSSLSGLYTAEDHAQRFEQAPSRFDRMASSTLSNNYAYDAQTWSSFGGPNSGLGPNNHMGGGTGRPKPQGRSRLPGVSYRTASDPVSYSC